MCDFHSLSLSCPSFFFFFNDTATTEIYTLSLHDALPILGMVGQIYVRPRQNRVPSTVTLNAALAQQQLDLRTKCDSTADRSEEHTSELQSRQYLVCRLLLEKNKCLGHASKAAGSPLWLAL